MRLTGKSEKRNLNPTSLLDVKKHAHRHLLDVELVRQGPAELDGARRAAHDPRLQRAQVQPLLPLDCREVML